MKLLADWAPIQSHCNSCGCVIQSAASRRSQGFREVIAWVHLDAEIDKEHRARTCGFKIITEGPGPKDEARRLRDEKFAAQSNSVPEMYESLRGNNG